MSEQRNLGRWVRPPIHEARLARQWSEVSSRLPGARPASGALRGPIPRLVAALAVAIAVVAIGVSLRKPPPAPVAAIDGAVLETGAGQQESLTLPDGSRIVLEALSRVRLARVSNADVRLELERGAVDLEVVHLDGRKFIVAARGVEVRVVGTKFRVAITQDEAVESVQVGVERGRVAVERSGATAPVFVSAGETWSARLDGLAAVAPPPAGPPSPPAPDKAAPKKAWAPKRKLPESFHAFFRDGEYASAYAEVADEDVAHLVTELGPQDLVELAIAARLSGHAKQAALALDRVRTAHRKDGRAGLAALDLGRLLLDELNDPAGAIDALEDAIALAPNATLREDAEARKVQAWERLGDMDRCAAARELYLSRYPQGAHTTTVARRCNGP